MTKEKNEQSMGKDQLLQSINGIGKTRQTHAKKKKETR